ncbi:MAG: HAD family hydrolase [Pirellulales bacterium]
MHYLALAFDYDGTLAKYSHVAAAVVHAIEKVRVAGYKTLLVTGRQLTELRLVFPRVELFDIIVAENGAELFCPAVDREEILGVPPSTEFLAEMARLDITPFSVGKVIFATWRPHEVAIADVILRLGLDYQIIFNKKAVMVLPQGIDKATGLAAALAQMSIPAGQVIGIGDAENDLPFLRICGFAATVENALPVVKAQCQFVASRDHGAGVVEMIRALLQGSLDEFTPRSVAASSSRSKSSTDNSG